MGGAAGWHWIWGKQEVGETRTWKTVEGTGTDGSVGGAGLRSSQKAPERPGEPGKGRRPVGQGWEEPERRENMSSTYEGMRTRFLTSNR